MINVYHSSVKVTLKGDGDPNRNRDSNQLLPFTHRCYMPKFVEIDSVVSEKKQKRLKVNKRRTTNDDLQTATYKTRKAIKHIVNDQGDLKSVF